jgi:hypothetical protein
MTFIDSILSHMSSITTWKRVRNSRTHPKVPITIIIIIIIIIVLPIHYFFSQYIIISRSFSSLLSLEVPHSYIYIYIYVYIYTCDISKTPLAKVFYSFCLFFIVISSSSVYAWMWNKDSTCAYVMILAYASTRFIRYVIASHTHTMCAPLPPVLFYEGHSLC